ncbi:PAS domain S-box protein [Dyadobacter sandarakinus]|uniref:histidine kinase n=1 Tax=Dyadobacter sandarakinus TaxID=2747268 RepID=A0ABX7IEE9_9BACT|nr:PAS domain S-box protein [Dyadobacter sandarakinus]QRR03907.1 PAS domain S-box protein [Dyadobacter sandarakinus]
MIKTREKGSAEKETLVSEIIYHDLFALNPHPMWVYDTTTLRILEVNHAALAHYGYSREEFFTLSVDDLVVCTEQAPSYDTLQELLAMPFSKPACRHRKKNGQVIDVEVKRRSITLQGREAELVVAADITDLSEAEHRRMLEFQRLRDAQKIAKVGYWRREIDQDISEWSAEMYELYGQDPVTFIPTYENLIACFHPDDRHLLNDETFARLHTHGFSDFEHRIITHSGEIKWVFQRLQFEHDHRNNVVAIKGIIQDITEKHEADEKLQEKEHRFKVLVQEGADLIAIQDYQGSYEFVSESSKPILGIPCEKLTGTNFFDYIHPDDRPSLQNLFGRLCHERQVRSEPFRFRAASGNYRWMRTIATDLTLDPAIKGIVTNTRDITETVLKNHALLLSNERYKMILRAANEAVYAWDIKLNVIEWGSGFQEIFGYDLLTADNRLWTDHIYPDDRDRVLCQMGHARNDASMEVLVFECRFVKANGETAQVEHRVVFTRDKFGRAIRAVGSVKDITAYKQSLLKIKLQNEKLKEIAWAQSHIVRAPLARMMGLIELLNTGGCDSMSEAEIMNHIRTSAEELDKIIKDIVSKAKPSWVAN